MKPDIYWIADVPYGRLATMPRPQGAAWLEEEISALKAMGIDGVVSLLTWPEAFSLGLQGEEQQCEQQGIQYISFPIPDMDVPPSVESALAVIQQIDDWLKDGRGVVIHCRAGIGRSGLMAACVLVTQGFPPDHACEAVSKARGLRSPETDEQWRWVKTFAASGGKHEG